MDGNDGHPVPRIDDTVNAANLHERAEAVAVPNFNYLEQIIVGVVSGLTHGRRHRNADRTGSDAGTERER